MGTRHEQAVRGQCQHAPGPSLPCGTGCPQQGVTGADQVIDDQCRRAGDIADKKVTRNNAAPLRCSRRRRCRRAAPSRRREPRGKAPARLAPPVSGETTDRRSSASRFICPPGRRGSEPDGTATEGVLESRLIVDFKRPTASVPTASNRRQRNVWSRDRSPWCGDPCGRSQIRNHCRDARRPGVLQCADEEQQPAQLVIGAVGRPPMQAVNDIDVGATNRIERPRLVFAILEVTLLMGRQRIPERPPDATPQFVRSVQGEQAETIAQPGRRPGHAGSFRENYRFASDRSPGRFPAPRCPCGQNVRLRSPAYATFAAHRMALASGQPMRYAALTGISSDFCASAVFGNVTRTLPCRMLLRSCRCRYHREPGKTG